MLTLRRRRQQGQFAPHHHRIPPARRWLPAAIAVLLLAAPVADAFRFHSEDTCGELCTDAFWGGGKVTVGAVARLLDEGVDVNAHDDSTSTPLHYAAAHASDPAIVQFLLARGAQVDAQNLGGQGSTPVEWAAANDNLTAAKALLDAGAQLNRLPSPICCLDKGWRALHMAAAWASAEMVELLISRGADVNAGRGYDPIHAAAERNPDPRVLEALVKAGADINARARGTDYAGWTPLFFAVRMNNSAVVRQLLSYRAIDVNAKGREEKRLGYGGDTALHAAIKGGRTTAARILLNDERVDIRIKNVAGETPEDLICDVARFSDDIKPGWCEQ